MAEDLDGWAARFGTEAGRLFPFRRLFAASSPQRIRGESRRIREGPPTRLPRPACAGRRIQVTLNPSGAFFMSGLIPSIDDVAKAAGKVFNDVSKAAANTAKAVQD